jgi:hypothetical protein
MDEDIVAMLLIGLTVLIPVTGVTLRFALKPIVDSIARLMEIREGRERSEVVEQRIALMEQELQLARAEIREMQAREDFYQRLGPGGA